MGGSSCLQIKDFKMKYYYYIPLDDYKKHIPDVGEQVHVNHTNCTAGTDTKRRLYIKNEGDKVLAYCHNCQKYAVYVSDFSYTTSITPIELVSTVLKVDNQSIDGDIALPDDVIPIGTGTPVECLAWLGGYNMTGDDCDKYGICYSPSYDRVILPVFDPDDGKLIYWQGRDCTGKSDMKYLNIKGVKKPLYVLRPIGPIGLGGDGLTRIVIVEDILSAIAINKTSHANKILAGTLAIALLGTKLSVDQLEKFPARNIYIWLDEDEAGRIAAIDLEQNLLMALNSNIYRVDTTQYSQPKKLSNDNKISDALIQARTYSSGRRRYGGK